MHWIWCPSWSTKRPPLRSYTVQNCYFSGIFWFHDFQVLWAFEHTVVYETQTVDYHAPQWFINVNAESDHWGCSSKNLLSDIMGSTSCISECCTETSSASPASNWWTRTERSHWWVTIYHVQCNNYCTMVVNADQSGSQVDTSWFWPTFTFLPWSCIRKEISHEILVIDTWLHIRT